MCRGGLPWGSSGRPTATPRRTGVEKWWNVGNEMYGAWQSAHMSLAHYVIKQNMFVETSYAEGGSEDFIVASEPCC